MNQSPVEMEINSLISELQQFLIFELQQSPFFRNQPDRRDVRLIYERITELNEYLQRLRYAIPIQQYQEQRQSQHQEQPHYPQRQPQPQREQQQQRQRQQQQQRQQLQQRQRQQQLQRQQQQQRQRHIMQMIPEIPAFGEVFQMNLDMPSWVIRTSEWGEWEIDEDEQAEIASFQAPQPSRRQPGLVTATKMLSTTYGIVETTNKDEACPICMEQFEASSIVRQLPCQHLFHDNCVLQWFVKDDRCPKCRTNINKISDKLPPEHSI